MRGTFQVRGIVSGVEKDSFYKETNTKTGVSMRMINFGVEFDKGKTLYVGINGLTRDKVYFSKTFKDEDGKNKTITEAVNWNDRNMFSKEGYRPIGINIGLTKTTDSQGKEVNNNKTYCDYDACKVISSYLQDGQSVFVKGNIEYSTYESRRFVRFVPTQISLTSKPVDFESEDYKVVANFTQPIVFMDIEKREDQFAVNAKIVGYNTVEDAEFVIENAKLANTFRKNLSPYTAIEVHGDIDVHINTDNVDDEDDGWGESNKMKRINNPVERVLVIHGADKDTIDTDTYTESEIEMAIARMKAEQTANEDYGEASKWGNLTNEINEEEDSWD